MKHRYWIFPLVVVAVVFFIYLERNDRQKPVNHQAVVSNEGAVTNTDPAVPGESLQVKSTPQDPAKSAGQMQQAKYVDQPDPNDPRMTRTSTGYNIYNPSFELSQTLAASSNTEESISAVAELLSAYKYAYKENPVALSNASVVSHLSGENPMKVIFMDQNIEAVVNGELVDHWGTPYFFHAESGQTMEIRSAGVDLEMWTDDDITSD